MLSLADALLTGHAHGVELIGWWVVIGGAASVSLWAWARGRRQPERAECEPSLSGTLRRLPGPVNPDEYAAHMINCADLIPAQMIISAPPERNSTIDTTDLISGHGNEYQALFHYPQPYAGVPATAVGVTLSTDRLACSIPARALHRHSRQA